MSKAVTDESIAMAKLKHERLPVPSEEDIRNMKEMLAKKVLKRTKHPKAKSVPIHEVERCIEDATMSMADTDFHIFFAALLMANISQKSFRECTRCLQKASEMYCQGLINLHDVRVTMRDEFGVVMEHDGRKWGFGK